MNKNDFFAKLKNISCENIEEMMGFFPTPMIVKKEKIMFLKLQKTKKLE